MPLPVLVNRSGITHAARVVRNLLKKYPCLAAALCRPGGRGRGGYAALVVQQRASTGPPTTDGGCEQWVHDQCRRAPGKSERG
jgi:hypothetical protein